MADPHHHAVSSQKKWGGEVSDYIDIHRWFDQPKQSFCDPRSRAIRHHAEGVAWAIQVFGNETGTITISTGKEIPVRWIGEQHCLEDFGRIPTMADWLRHMTIEPWMVKGARKLSIELEKSQPATAGSN